jgi:hypothetical protein
MPLTVRAFPLHGPLSGLEAFAAQLKSERRAAAMQFFREYGVSHESWHLQQTPNGPWIIAVTQLQDPGEAAPRYAKSNAEFDAWFKNQVRSLTGVDPNTTPLGPPTTEIFSWSEVSQQRLANKPGVGP